MVSAPRSGTPRRAAFRLLFAAVLSTALGFTVQEGNATADTTPVAIGEVSAAAGHEDAAKTIKLTLGEELAKVKVPSGKHYIVSASLVKLETRTTGGDARVEAVVSLAIRDAKDGAIRGVVSGSGTLSTKSGDPTATKLAVETAVRGATKNINVVISKS